MIEIDGSYLEGGGQIVRTALALSMYTGKPFKVTDIRQGRPNPGLKSQHLQCIRSLLELTSYKAKEDGAELGAEELTFYPAKIIRARLNIDIGTAGSVTLLLQSLLLPIIFGERKTKLNIKGGTDTKWSPLFDYFNQVIISRLKLFANIEIILKKRGFYPRGGGEIEIRIQPLKLEHLPNILLTESGELLHISGKAFASKELMKAEVAERTANSARATLRSLTPHINITTEYNDSYSAGAGISLWAAYQHSIIGADKLGERNMPSEDLGKEAADELIKLINTKAPVDEHLADNLIPFLGIAGGEIKTNKITNHTLTNIYVVEKFLNVKYKVDKENNIITVTNI